MILFTRPRAPPRPPSRSVRRTERLGSSKSYPGVLIWWAWLVVKSPFGRRGRAWLCVRIDVRQRQEELERVARERREPMVFVERLGIDVLGFHNHRKGSHS